MPKVVVALLNAEQEFQQLQAKDARDSAARLKLDLEVTFAEVRRHLGVETQRQWSDPAIARTTPALLGLFSLVTLWADDLYAKTTPTPRTASWYPKPLPTFSDAIAAVRRELWTPKNFQTSASSLDFLKIHTTILNSLVNVACYAD